MIIELIEEKSAQTSKKNDLMKRYQYLVKKIANNFKNAPGSRENLEEVGYIGLLNAANLYDKCIHQMNFKTYAQLLITEEMHQYLMNRNRQENRPDWLVQLNYKIDQYVIHYRKQHQCFPQISEIASHLNINTFGLQEVLRARDSLRESYLSHRINQNNDLSQIQPELEKIKTQSYQSFKLPIEDLITLQKVFKRLKTLQVGIVYYLFVMDLSKTKVAKMLGIPTHKVDQLKKKVL